MGKTRKNYKNNKGGKVIASGGFGCVFNPALKCEGAKNREKNKISKLMTERYARQEYEEISKIKDKLDTIPKYNDYFLLYDMTLCKPSKLTATDLVSYAKKCTALPKNNIDKENINSKLDELMSLNMPNGGLPVDDYLYDNGSYEKLYKVHNKLVKLLKNGIIPMNNKNIYHSDIKDSNILIDDTNSDLKARLIDWGLAVEYSPSETLQFPRNWRNRPFQFNVPFSVIIFSDSFYEKYSEYLKKGGKTNESSLRPFVIDYINFWMKERGAGHYKFINQIIYMLYNHNFSSISEKNKPAYIEAEITMPLIIDYIVEVLVHYTKFKSDGTLNLREYLIKVFIKIIDIWGFINVYYPYLEIMSKNYFNLKANELKVFQKLEFIFNYYLYSPRSKPIDMNDLFDDLKNLGNLLYDLTDGKTTLTSSDNLAKGIKTRKLKKSKLSTSLFKRIPLKKRFNNPLFLSLK
jgi:serine/threonine protein kinase